VAFHIESVLHYYSTRKQEKQLLNVTKYQICGLADGNSCTQVQIKTYLLVYVYTHHMSAASERASERVCVCVCVCVWRGTKYPITEKIHHSGFLLRNADTGVLRGKADVMH